MNEHEAERIAAAMNQLRPDWPLKQLRTLLADPRIAHRPRRDVSVALSWVACEVNTATPYRVLESGPWWKAAGVEGTFVPKLPTSGNACWTCGKVYRLDLADDGRTDACCDEPMRRPEHGADPAPYVEQIRKAIR